MRIKIAVGVSLYSLCLIANASWWSDAKDSVSNNISDASESVGNNISDASESVGNNISDASESVGNNISDASDSIEKGVEDFWEYLGNIDLGFGSTCEDDEGKSHSVSAGTDCGRWREKRRKSVGGFGEDEIVLNIDNLYLPHMNNESIKLSVIEGEVISFSWVPISVGDITTFIPYYGSNIPKRPTSEEIWNNIDRDNDGIYDDIEFFVARNFPDKPDVRYSAYRYAHSLKQLVDNIGHWDEFKSASINLGKAEFCLKKNTTREESTAIQINALGTLSRVKAYSAFQYMQGDMLLNLHKSGALKCQ